MNKSDFLNTIERKIEKHHLLNHSFYKAWNAGELNKSVIQEYAAQYFKHVSAFPRYLSSIHSNCDDIKVRQEILENLIDEERGEENHPELWMRFAEGMGKKREDVKNTVAIKETKELVDNFMKLSKDGLGILISDHNVKATMDICEEVFVINNGKIISSGNPKEVSNNEIVKKVYLGDMY